MNNLKWLLMKNLFLTFMLFTWLCSFSQDIEKGNLGEKKSKLIKELYNLTGKNVDSLKIIVINFYDKPEVKSNGSCIDYYSSDRSYRRFLKRHPDILQFFVTQKGYKYKKRNFIEDKNNIIRSLVFEEAQDCGNYIILKPDGGFIRQLGEYRQDKIPEFIQKMKK